MKLVVGPSRLRGEIAVTGPDGELFGVIANADLVAALARRRVETAH